MTTELTLRRRIDETLRAAVASFRPVPNIPTFSRSISAASIFLLAALLVPIPQFGQQQNHPSGGEMASVGVHTDELGKDGICADKKLHDYSGWCATTAFPLKLKIVSFAAQPQTADVGMQCHSNGRCDMRTVTLSSGQMVMTCVTNTLSCPSDIVFMVLCRNL